MQSDYARIERAIRFLDRRFLEQPSLAEVAAEVGLSEFHCQRIFSRWAGISPKRFLQFLTATHARTLLLERRSVLSAAYAGGLSGPGRLHDLMVSVHAATPGEIKTGGEGVEIAFGVQPTPFGEAFLAASGRGVCALAFVEGDDGAAARDRLRRDWPRATLREDAVRTAALARRIFDAPAEQPGEAPIRLHVRGTNFQLRVWEALLRVPAGEVTTYGDLARSIEAPRAARAVGAAVGANAIAYLIPCHRVIRETGAFGGYRWGPPRKRALLAWESARTEPHPHAV
jgi:AraC family transcriptional regulator, regulatory protein of adaptative response / methylated-DNA-[protein]-cysteine methyltransferase